MDFLELKNISERYMELVNPTTPEKVLTIGTVLGLHKGSRVIDFGCGYGEVLALWAQNFDISGVGIDIRLSACERAQQKMRDHGLANRITIICANAAEYAFEPHTYDVAACIGATFIWDSFQAAIGHMKAAIRPNGKLAVGEAHWRSANIPPEYAQTQPIFHHEYELAQLARTEGFDLEYLVRASHSDWDRYESDNWYGLVRWLEANPDHPAHAEVAEHLHSSQDEYLRYGREYLGWAMYVLNLAASSASPYPLDLCPQVSSRGV